jgi:peptidoglycan/LPS O-acetylase OafA/YrhL
LATVIQWFFDANLGVRCFFIISGFLITLLMIQEDERRGTVLLGRFYIRRGFRILPVFLAFLLVLAALQALTPFEMPARKWVVQLTFTSNYFVTTQVKMRAKK